MCLSNRRAAQPTTGRASLRRSSDRPHALTGLKSLLRVYSLIHLSHICFGACAFESSFDLLSRYKLDSNSTLCQILLLPPAQAQPAQVCCVRRRQARSLDAIAAIVAVQWYVTTDADGRGGTDR